MPLLNTQYDTIMRYYDELRASQAEDARLRREEIERRLPAYKEADEACIHMAAEIARNRLRRPGQSTAADEAALEALRQKRDRILTDAGYPADYTAIRYICPACRDTGFIEGEKCSCFKNIAVSLLYRQYALDDILKEENFEHFQIDRYSDTIKDESGFSSRDSAIDALEKSLALVRRIGEDNNNLLLMGRAGVGKTFLTHCITEAAIRDGHSALYFSAHDFFEILADGLMGKTPESATYTGMIKSCDLLIIDDLGTELTNNLTESELFNVLNERMRRRLSTVISTNLSLHELAGRYSERITSRMFSSSQIAEISGEDIRMKNSL